MIFLDFLRHFIYFLCWVLTILIILRALISWFPLNPESRLVVLLYQLTEPVLAPLRRIIPRTGMIDLTPMIAIIIIWIIASLVEYLP